MLPNTALLTGFSKEHHEQRFEYKLDPDGNLKAILHDGLCRHKIHLDNTRRQGGVLNPPEVQVCPNP